MEEIAKIQLHPAPPIAGIEKPTPLSSFQPRLPLELMSSKHRNSNNGSAFQDSSPGDLRILPPWVLLRI